MKVHALLCDATDKHAPLTHEHALPIDERADSQYYDARDRTNLSPHDDVDALSVLRSVNPKVLYHRPLFAPTIPHLTDVQDYFHMPIQIHSEIQSSTNLVVGDYDGCLDDNVFTVILFVLTQQNLNRSEMCELQRVALPTCSRCRKLRIALEYTTQNRNLLYELCNKCRGNMELQTMFPKMLYTKMAFHHPFPRISLSTWALITIQAGRELEMGCMCMVITTNRQNHSVSIAEQIRKNIEQIETCSYVRKQLRNGAAYYLCSQKYYNRENKHSMPSRHHRESRRMQYFRGFLSMPKPKHNTIVTRFGHQQPHEAVTLYSKYKMMILLLYTN